MNTADIPEASLGVAVIYATRYALGRQSGAPHDALRLIRTTVPHLNRGDREVLRRDIDGWLRELWHDHPHRDVWIQAAEIVDQEWEPWMR